MASATPDTSPTKAQLLASHSQGSYHNMINNMINLMGFANSSYENIK